MSERGRREKPTAKHHIGREKQPVGQKRLQAGRVHIAREKNVCGTLWLEPKTTVTQSTST